MKRLRMSCVLTLAALMGSLSPPRSFAVEPVSQNVIVLIDRSESIASSPHVQEAVVNQFLEISRLTNGRVKLAFIFFGHEVHTVAGADGLPAPASEPIRQGCYEQLAKPCIGGTPLSIALSDLQNMLAAIPDNELRTVVCLGDGEPNLPLSPELFPEVKAELDQMYAEAEADQDPEAVRKLEERLSDVHSEVAQHLFAVQDPHVRELCLQLAGTINSHNARIVSIAFQTGLTGLQEIHNAAGGNDEDYLETKPANSLETLYEAQVVSGLVAFETIHLDASDQFRFTSDIALAGDLDAETLLTVQPVPTAEIEKLASLGIQTAGRSNIVGQSGSELSVARDSGGRLATLSLLCPASSSSARFAFASQEEQLAFPGAKVFRLTELPDDLRFVCRPAESEDATPPYEVIKQKDLSFLVGLQYADGRGVPMQGGEIVFKHAETGRQHLVSLVRDRQYKELWLAPADDLDAGTYDVIANLKLASGIPFRISKERHFTVVGVEQRVRLDVGQESASIDRLDFGKLGDDVLERKLQLTIASDTPLDLPLEFRITDLRDSQGNPIGSPWIKLADENLNGDKLVLPAGETIEVEFVCSLPKQVPDEIADGVVQGNLEVLNADTLQPVTVVPAVPDLATCDSLATVQLSLARPQIILSAPRAFGELIQSRDGQQTLTVNANIAFAYGRNVKVEIATTSALDREVYLRVGSPRDKVGKRSESPTLGLEKDFVGYPILIPAGETVAIQLPFSVQDAEQRGYGAIAISGPGFASSVLYFDVGSTLSYGNWLKLAILLFTPVLAWRFILHTVRIRRWNPFLKTNSPSGRRFVAGNILGMVRFEAAGDQIRLIPEANNLEIEIGLNEPYPFEREELVSQTNQVSIYSANGCHLEITGFSPDGSECWVRVNSGGEQEQKCRTAYRRRRNVIAYSFLAACILIGVGRWDWMTERAQYGFDLVGLNVYATDFPTTTTFPIPGTNR